MTIPLWCVVFAFVLIYLPKLPGSLAMARQPGGYDNRLPRAQQAQLEGWGARAMAAHYNGFEAFGPFAAAALISHVAAPGSTWASPLAITFVAARIVFVGAYLGDLHPVRSLAWLVGLTATSALMVLPAWGL